jgi:signal peptidase II
MRLMLVISLLLCCVGCDQVTKSFARENLAPGVVTSYAHDMFRLVYSENPGAFLSLGASLPELARVIVFQVLVGALVFGLFFAAWRWRGLSKPQVVAFALLCASGLGNLIDRLLYDGRVTDFLNLGIGPLRTGIFNVADVVGVVGAVLLFVQSAKPEKTTNDGDAL